MPVEDGSWEDDVPAPPPQHQPADEANLGATSPGPPDVEPDSVPIEEPHRATQALMSESADTETEDEALPEFDPRFRDDFEGLLYLGHLTDTFTWLGHTFRIRTLYTGEVLEVGMLHRPYVGSMADIKAYQAAVTAACVVEVDSKPMPTPLTNDPSDTPLKNRFEYVLRSWFPPTLDVIYERYLLLEKRVEEVIEAMGKAPGWTAPTPTSNDTSV